VWSMTPSFLSESVPALVRIAERLPRRLEF
jgi:hypothetical protein